MDIQATIDKWTAKVKAWRNSFRIPSLLSLAIRKDGKINPSIEEALNEAPPASQNWIRLGLGWVVAGPVKVWHIIALAILSLLLRIFADSLKFFIDFSLQLLLLAPFVAIVYFIWKALKK